MTGRERLLEALRRGAPEHVPFFDQLYHRDLAAHVLGTRPEAYSITGSATLAASLGLDAAVLVFAGYPAFATGAEARSWTSEWGVTYSLEGAGWPTGFGVSFALAAEGALGLFSPPDPRSPSRWEEAREAAALLHGKGMAAIGALRGPFAMLAWHLLGVERTLTAVIEEPALVAGALAVYGKHAEGLIDEWAGLGADAVFMTEDLGSAHGPLLSPRQYEELFAPSLSRLGRRIRGHGMELIVHSDGMVLPFFRLFIAAGTSAVHPIERRAGMSLAACKRDWGGTLAFCGNLDTKGALRSGTPEEVRADVRAVLAEGSPGGGYVFSTDHSVSEGIPLANALAMLEELERSR